MIISDFFIIAFSIDDGMEWIENGCGDCCVQLIANEEDFSPMLLLEYVCFVASN